jgi:tetratricopeptide (TPR) repeat protein
MARLKKKEIQQDKFISYVADTIKWVKANTQTVLSVTLGIALGIALILFYRSYKAENIQASLELLAKGDVLYQKNIDAITGNLGENSDKPKTISPINNVEIEEAIGKYNEVIEEYPSSNAAAFAMLDKGNALFLSKKYDDAIKAYTGFLDKRIDSPFTDTARENLIIAYMEKKDYATAKKEAETFIKQTTITEFKARLTYRLGQICDLMGNSKEAKELYKKITEEYKDTAISREAANKFDGPNPGSSFPSNMIINK